jgi:N utilization substance protein A
LLRRLLELEVPEIFNGAVEIKAIAREAGSRSKVAVHATQEGVDPVGSCVGVRGGRIQNIVTELSGEKIDIVQWDSDLGTYIANALSPAKVMNVLLDEDPDAGKTATVIVPDRQLSLAIGKEGQNARLAAKLTGWRIDIKSATEAAIETLGPLVEVEVPREDMDLIQLAEAMLREGIAETDKERVKDEVEVGREVDLPWPDEEPVLEAEEELEAEDLERVPVSVVEGVDGQEAGPVPASGVEAETPIPATEELDEKPPVAAEAEGTAAEVPEGADEVSDEMVPEMEPPFEGEPIEGTIGWVAVEPEEDYYSGWADEEEADGWDVEWPPMELEEEEEEPERRDEKKKKKKKRARRVPGYELNDEMERDRRRKRGSSRRGW